MTRKHLSGKGLRASCRPPDDHKPASSELRMVKASSAAGGVLPASITQHWQATAGVLGSGLDSQTDMDIQEQVQQKTMKIMTGASDIQREDERAGMLSLEKVWDGAGGQHALSHIINT